MSNSISTSLNMRTLKEAMADQETHENLTQSDIEVSENSEIDLTDYSENTQSSPMDKAYKDLTELDQVVFEHTKTSDSVADQAKDAFDKIFAVAQSVPPEKSARLFEVAAQYLDIINKSSDSKVSAKYDRAKLSVALTRAQIQAGLVENAVNEGIKAHRNDILKAIMGGDTQDADFEEKTDPEDDK